MSQESQEWWAFEIIKLGRSQVVNGIYYERSKKESGLERGVKMNK